MSKSKKLYLLASLCISQFALGINQSKIIKLSVNDVKRVENEVISSLKNRDARAKVCYYVARGIELGLVVQQFAMFYSLFGGPISDFFGKIKNKVAPKVVCTQVELRDLQTELAALKSRVDRNNAESEEKIILKRPWSQCFQLFIKNIIQGNPSSDFMIRSMVANYLVQGVSGSLRSITEPITINWFLKEKTNYIEVFKHVRKILNGLSEEDSKKSRNLKSLEIVVNTYLDECKKVLAFISYRAAIKQKSKDDNLARCYLDLKSELFDSCNKFAETAESLLNSSDENFMRSLVEAQNSLEDTFGLLESFLELEKSDKNFSASKAALHPEPADVMACL